MSAHYAKTDGITLVGGGSLDAATLARALAHAPHLVAADGGGDLALALGYTPDLVIGDFDSLTDAGRATLGEARLLEVPQQDNTDFDKALEAIDAPVILAVGFSGGRLDHTLAAMNALARNKNRQIIIDTGEDLCLLLPPELTLTLRQGTRVSLFPLGPVTCTSQGLEWPTHGLPFTPLGQIGTSNAASGGPVTLRADAPAMLLLIPETELANLLNSLPAAPLWPDAARGQ
ncbi:thiamine diphosphokinase [Pararhodobacter oceanensis]|uniref:thiamine diphosphokinase n=1 Tax=Pararhodobacter oceanensis TaxID=2172121 RepID=UPI003A91576C